MIINLPDRNTIITTSEENNKYFSNNFLEIIKIFIGQKSRFYIFFSSFIFSFFYYIIKTLIINNYSPYVIILVEDILPLDNDIIKIALHQENEYVKMIRDKILKRFYWQTVGFAILFFGALILNEIIIFNFCGLNKYKAWLNKRIENIFNTHFYNDF